MLVFTEQEGQISCPYPGLRPFTKEESQIFFGRDDQTDQLLDLLHTAHFLAVVGASGCGKSSLVRAGLMADLEGGLMGDAGGHWEMVEMRPGNDPFSALRDALLAENSLRSRLSGDSQSSEEMAYRSGFLRATLRARPLGLVDILTESVFPARTNFLLLVDQFEEIFTTRALGLVDETEAFVSLLLSSAAQRELPLYVVLTMRSDYLGNCTIFSGLPEAINQSQYLTPRLDREQCAEAIIGPSKLGNGSIDAALVNELLNMTSPSEDQLPVLQHLLMRMWTLASDRASSSNGGPGEVLLTHEHYITAGGLEGAISKHAGSAYEELATSDQRQIAQVLFRSICERGEDNREKRRLVSVKTIASIVGATPEEVIAVADAFRRPDRSFLMPSADKPLGHDTTLDICHEALIRNWDKLKEWVRVEAKSAKDYRWIEQAAQRRRERMGGLFSGRSLKTALEWERRERPSREWATRYGEDYELAMDFLRKSGEHRQKIRLLGATTVCGAALVVGLLTLKPAEQIVRNGANAANVAFAAQAQSDQLLATAENILAQTENPRAKALALATISRAVARNQHNFKAARRACELLLENTWCPPLVQPLHYVSEGAVSDSPLLAACFAPPETGERVFAISQDGWLLGWSAKGAALGRLLRLLNSEQNPRTVILSASFSGDGREIFTITSLQSGGQKGQFWKLENGTYKPEQEFNIKNGQFRTMSWSDDGKLLIVVPGSYNHLPVVQAFRFDRTVYNEIPSPFGDFPAVSVAINSNGELVATVDQNGAVQLWKSQGNTFAKVESIPSLKGFSARPYSIVFGPGTENLTESEFDSKGQSRVQILNFRTNDLRILDPPTTKDQFIQLRFTPSGAMRPLVAAALFARVEINDTVELDLQNPLAVPICFQGTTAIQRFNESGDKLLTLSGAVWLAMDTVQLWDVSLKFAKQIDPELPSEGQPVPDWLADLARAVSGIPREDEENPSPTLESVRATIEPGKMSPPYAKLLNHFFPDMNFAK
jgi:hypothetical protein